MVGKVVMGEARRQLNNRLRTGGGFNGGGHQHQSQDRSHDRSQARPRGRTNRADGDVHVVDGDTFFLGEEKIRIKGIDTPEIGDPKCLAERLLGEQAKLYLAERLNSGEPLELERVETDQYGRTLAYIYVGGRSVGQELIDNGLAVAYRGHKCDWCG